MSFSTSHTIEADGTMVETSGERKEGIGMNYKKQWGYHPLVVTLANTGEPLYVVNRSGNRPSHEHSPFFIDLAIEQCRTAGFRKIVVRGDTDFALTENFDRWTEDGVEFIFGVDQMPNLVATRRFPGKTAWRPLRRRSGRNPRRQPSGDAGRITSRRSLSKRNTKTNGSSRNGSPSSITSRASVLERIELIAVRKEIEITKGQQKLFDDTPYLFYITNASRSEKSDRQVVFAANDRCDQENTISQMKACGALTAPVGQSRQQLGVHGDRIACLVLEDLVGLDDSTAWGQSKAKKAEAETKRRVIRMDFKTFCQTLMQVPAQIISRSRQLVYRLLSYRQIDGALAI